MKSVRQALALLLFFLWTVAGWAEVKVLTGFTLIDGNGGKPVPGSAMIVTDGKITWVGPAGQLKAPQGAETINLQGKYVMPGIINLHCHLGNVVGLKQDPANFTRQNLENQLKTFASYGVTSVLSMGSDQDLVFQVRSEQRAGRPRMARIYTAGRGFTGKDGYPTQAPGMAGVPFEVENPEQVRKNVATLADQQVDVVKIWIDDHLGREEKIPLEISRAIIQNAHKHNLKAIGHIFYYQDAKELSEAGLDALGHSVRDRLVDDAFIATMKKNNTWQAAATLAREISTFIYAKENNFLDDPFFQKSAPQDVINTLKSPDYRKRLMSDPDFPKLEGFLENAKKNLKRLVDGGVRYGFGTDSGPPARFSGYFEHLEMELMADAGLTPNQIITAATRNSAEFLGAKDLGTLESGKWADLIVLSRNPLQDVKNARSLEAVYIAGNKVN
jgi:imidazolonepropionase-like amidohydrolase